MQNKVNSSKRVLVAEDEGTIRDFVVINLERAGYSVSAVEDGEQAIDIYDRSREKFDIVLLDIMMPKKDGILVCKHIREKDKITGIIILSAKSQEMDKVNGLMIGADDYITKPFSPSELLARVDAISRRMSAMQCENQRYTITSGPFIIDFVKKAVLKNDVELDLTVTEYALMELFLKNKNVAFSRAEILNKLWVKEKDVDEKAVDVNIRRLRTKVEDEPSNPKYIYTVWGTGYRWMCN